MGSSVPGRARERPGAGSDLGLPAYALSARDYVHTALETCRRAWAGALAVMLATVAVRHRRLPAPLFVGSCHRTRSLSLLEGGPPAGDRVFIVHFRLRTPPRPAFRERTRSPLARAPTLILTMSQPRSRLSIARSNIGRFRTRRSRSSQTRMAQTCCGLSAR